ncbi:unnamed protein product, partial [Durusdinium trenchii]
VLQNKQPPERESSVEIPSEGLTETSSPTEVYLSKPHKRERSSSSSVTADEFESRFESQIDPLLHPELFAILKAIEKETELASFDAVDSDAE